MNIQGLQKLTLLDYPGRVACTIFTGGCNFRCPFCHNAQLVLAPAEFPPTPEEEILAFLKKRRGILDGVAITGGEPTLHADLPDFIARVRELGYPVKLDSNGTNPKMLAQLIDAGLVDRIAMDVKNSPQLYDITAGVADIDLGPIRESVCLLLEGKVDYEFRTTVMKPLHTPESMLGIAEWIQGAKSYFLQGFVDSGSLISDGMAAFSLAEMQALADVVRPFVPGVQLRGVE